VAQLTSLGQQTAQRLEALYQHCATQQAEVGDRMDAATARLAALRPPAARNGPLPQSWRRILGYLAAEGPQRPAAIAHALGMSREVRDYLRRMEPRGLVVRRAPGVWDVGSNGAAAQQ
jgi:hypothetical protein